MRILLCSDSHGDDNSLDKLILLYPRCDLYLHAGDSETHEDFITPFITVKGNCDYFSDAPEKRIIKTPYGNLLMQHKPIVSDSFLKENQIKIFVYGHTHMRFYKEENGVISINPGAISFDRDGNACSYAILDIDESSVRVNFFSLLD